MPGANSNEGQAVLLLRRVFADLNRHEIRYAIPRNWKELPHRTGRDLDMLVPADQLDAAVRLIRLAAPGCGFLTIVCRDDGQGLTVDAVPSRPPLDAGSASAGISFDLRTYVSLKPNELRARGTARKVFAEDMERRIVELSGCSVQVLAPVDEFVCLYFQHQMKRAQGIGHKVREYRETLEQMLSDAEVSRWLEDALSPERMPSIRSIAFDPARWQGFANALLCRRWGRASVFARLRAEMRALTIRARFLRPRLGPIVYLSGPDGAGKTTITNGVIARLGECGVQVKPVYSLKILIRAVTKRLAFLKRIGQPKGPKSAAPEYVPPDLLFMTEDTRDRDTGTFYWRFRKLGALLVGIVDIWLGWLIALRWRLRSRVVLVETSPHDIFIKYHMPEFVTVERVLGPLIPGPSAGFLMTADPERIFARKAELTVAEIVEYYARFARTLERCGTAHRYVSVRTDIDSRDTIAQVTGAILAARA